MASRSARSELKLDWCSHEAAKYACENWHYSRSVPVGKTVKVGVWEDGRFVGCVIFARGANNNLLKPYGLSQVEGAELARVAIGKHCTPVSRIIRIALKMLVKQSPGMRLVVSFADTKQGHYGGIYQAGGWVFVGDIDAPTEYLYRGRWIHSMQVQTFIRSGRLTSRVGLPKRDGSVKHRYLMPLDDEMRAKIAPLAKPYPKRAGSSASGTSPVQGGGGGANPTPALHSETAVEQ